MKKVLPSRQLPLISHPVTHADVGHFMEPRANILVFYATAAHCSTACLQHNAGTPYLHMSRHPCHCDCFSQGLFPSGLGCRRWVWIWRSTLPSGYITNTTACKYSKCKWTPLLPSATSWCQDFGISIVKALTFWWHVKPLWWLTSLRCQIHEQNSNCFRCQ